MVPLPPPLIRGFRGGESPLEFGWAKTKFVGGVPPKADPPIPVLYTHLPLPTSAKVKFEVVVDPLKNNMTYHHKLDPLYALH